MHERRRTVVFSGGGTGGHLYPALALADALRGMRPDVDAVFLGARRGIESRVLPARGERHRLLPVRGFARGGSLRSNLGVPGAVLRSVMETVGWFHSLAPELVVVTGGYAGAPAGIAAFLMGVPLVLQEANALPGVTTRLLARAAKEIHVGYAEAIDFLPVRTRNRARATGNPVRPPVRRGVESVRRELGLLPDRATLLVVGGSQGSVALNRAAVELVQALSGDPGFQILWATGPRWEAEVRSALGGRLEADWLTVTGYLDDMPAALEAADLAVSRAGAMTTSEFLAWGLPAILVPLPTSAEDHQTRNALALEAAGCAAHLPQSEATGAALLDRARSLLGDHETRAAMAARAFERACPEAAGTIARSLSLLLGNGQEVVS